MNYDQWKSTEPDEPRPDFTEDELAEMAQAREDDARLAHLEGWCRAHQTTPDRLTVRQIEMVWAEWRAREKRGAA